MSFYYFRISSNLITEVGGGGAWPIVCAVICLVDSDNERDSALLTSPRIAPRAG